MKLWSQLPRTAPCSLFLAACLVCSDAFKMQGEQSEVVKLFVKDMEGATHLAQVAYQQRLISTNTLKALSNASSLVEAAHSAGLNWTHSDAQRHIVLTAQGLKNCMESGLLRSRGNDPELSDAFEAAEADFDGLKGMVGKVDKKELATEAFGATLGLLTDWATSGKPPGVEDIVTLGFDMATMAIGMFNPLLGAVAGMAFSIIGSILFPSDPESPMEKMYKQIMEEVGTAISIAQAQAAVQDMRAELGAVMDEMRWMPALLGGTGNGQVLRPSPDQARILLTYDLMIQHDIAKIAHKIQNSPNAAASLPLDEPRKLWAATLFPIAGQIILLQTNLLYDIAAHELVDNPSAAVVRILDLLKDWQKWIGDNLRKAHRFNQENTRDVLNWRGDSVGIARKDTCETRGTDACLTMKCPPFDTNYTYKDSNHDHSDECCDSRVPFDYFFWDYVAPKISKIQTDVENMIMALGPAHDFEKVGRGRCRLGTLSNHGVNDASLKNCAKKCREEVQCKYFSLSVGMLCTLHDSGAGDCSDMELMYTSSVVYRRKATVSSPDPFHRVWSTAFCSSPAVFDGGAWGLVQAGEVQVSRPFNTPGYKEWVKAAWARCLNRDAGTTHVAVWTHGGYRCYKTTHCHPSHNDDAEIWTYQKFMPSYTRAFSTGFCSGSDLFDGGAWGLLVGGEPQVPRPFNSPGYQEWVAAAWSICLTKDAGTTHVSVWTHGGFRCYKTSQCSHEYNSDAETWTKEKPMPSYQRAFSHGFCSQPSNAPPIESFDGGAWGLLKDGEPEKFRPFNSPGYLEWVEAAWAKCLKKHAGTTHVSVWDNGGFRCYNTTGCTPSPNLQTETWTKKKLAPIIMKHFVNSNGNADGFCEEPESEPVFQQASGAWQLALEAAGTKGFETEEYMSWVRQAWARCVARNANTTFVSVFVDAGFRCFDSSTCTVVPDQHVPARTWSRWFSS